jgi:hypothetical protein
MILRELDDGRLFAEITNIDILNNFQNFTEFPMTEEVAKELRQKQDYLDEDRWKLVIGRYPGETKSSWEISDPSLQDQFISLSGAKGVVKLEEGIPVLAFG